MRYEDAKEIILEKITTKTGFNPDADFLINAAEREDFEIFQEMLGFPGCTFNPVTINEIQGLVLHQRTSKNAAEILEGFVEDMKERIDKVNEEESRKIQTALHRLKPLLPRCVANKILLPFMDELQEKCRALEPKSASITQEELDEFARYYKQRKPELKQQCRDEYEELRKQLGMPEVDTEEYFKDVDRYLKSGVIKVENAAFSGKGMNVVVYELSELRRKTYDADIRFVANAIASGIETVSQDSDVLWLMTFYALRRAA